MAKMEIKYYSPAAFGEVLHIHRNTIRELCRKGEIPAVKVGRQYRIPSTLLTSVNTPGQDDDDENDD